MKLIKEFIKEVSDNFGGIICLVFVMALGVVVLLMDGEIL